VHGNIVALARAILPQEALVERSFLSAHFCSSSTHSSLCHFRLDVVFAKRAPPHIFEGARIEFKNRVGPLGRGGAFLGIAYHGLER
jgi:hypothetical protein